MDEHGGIWLPWIEVRPPHRTGGRIYDAKTERSVAEQEFAALEQNETVRVGWIEFTWEDNDG
jgi:hypothetical protein